MNDPLAALLVETEGFEWDAANEPKLLARHDVTRAEVEQLFFHVPILLAIDLKHSASEPRYLALGRTVDNRLLHLVFTIRGRHIRPISARNMNRKERTRYAQAQA
ncbi:MAG: BrnT family toxin [Gemmatimonadales bacterium]